MVPKELHRELFHKHFLKKDAGWSVQGISCYGKIKQLLVKESFDGVQINAKQK